MLASDLYGWFWHLWGWWVFVILMELMSDFVIKCIYYPWEISVMLIFVVTVHFLLADNKHLKFWWNCLHSFRPQDNKIKTKRNKHLFFLNCFLFSFLFFLCFVFEILKMKYLTKAILNSLKSNNSKSIVNKNWKRFFSSRLSD